MPDLVLNQGQHKPIRTQREAALHRARAAFVQGNAYIVLKQWDEDSPCFYIPETGRDFHRRSDVVKDILEGQYDDGPLMVLGCVYGRIGDASEAIAQDVLRQFIAGGQWEHHDIPAFCLNHLDDAEEQVAEARQEAEEEARYQRSTALMGGRV